MTTYSDLVTITLPSPDRPGHSITLPALRCSEPGCLNVLALQAWAVDAYTYTCGPCRRVGPIVGSYTAGPWSSEPATVPDRYGRAVDIVRGKSGQLIGYRRHDRPAAAIVPDVDSAYSQTVNGR